MSIAVWLPDPSRGGGGGLPAEKECPSIGGSVCFPRWTE